MSRSIKARLAIVMFGLLGAWLPSIAFGQVFSVPAQQIDAFLSLDQEENTTPADWVLSHGGKAESPDVKGDFLYYRHEELGIWFGPFDDRQQATSALVRLRALTRELARRNPDRYVTARAIRFRAPADDTIRKLYRDDPNALELGWLMETYEQLEVIEGVQRDLDEALRHVESLDPNAPTGAVDRARVTVEEGRLNEILLSLSGAPEEVIPAVLLPGREAITREESDALRSQVGRVLARAAFPGLDIDKLLQDGMLPSQAGLLATTLREGLERAGVPKARAEMAVSELAGLAEMQMAFTPSAVQLGLATAGRELLESLAETAGHLRSEVRSGTLPTDVVKRAAELADRRRVPGIGDAMRAAVAKGRRFDGEEQAAAMNEAIRTAAGTIAGTEIVTQLIEQMSKNGSLSTKPWQPEGDLVAADVDAGDRALQGMAADRGTDLGVRMIDRAKARGLAAETVGPLLKAMAEAFGPEGAWQIAEASGAVTATGAPRQIGGEQVKHMLAELGRQSRMTQAAFKVGSMPAAGALDLAEAARKGLNESAAADFAEAIRQGYESAARRTVGLGQGAGGDAAATDAQIAAAQAWKDRAGLGGPGLTLPTGPGQLSIKQLEQFVRDGSTELARRSIESGVQDRDAADRALRRASERRAESEEWWKGRTRSGSQDGNAEVGSDAATGGGSSLGRQSTATGAAGMSGEQIRRILAHAGRTDGTGLVDGPGGAGGSGFGELGQPGQDGQSAQGERGGSTSASGEGGDSAGGDDDGDGDGGGGRGGGGWLPLSGSPMFEFIVRSVCAIIQQITGIPLNPDLLGQLLYAAFPELMEQVAKSLADLEKAIASDDVASVFARLSEIARIIGPLAGNITSAVDMLMDQGFQAMMQEVAENGLQELAKGGLERLAKKHGLPPELAAGILGLPDISFDEIPGQLERYAKRQVREELTSRFGVPDGLAKAIADGTFDDATVAGYAADRLRKEAAKRGLSPEMFDKLASGDVKGAFGEAYARGARLDDLVEKGILDGEVVDRIRRGEFEVAAQAFKSQMEELPERLQRKARQETLDQLTLRGVPRSVAEATLNGEFGQAAAAVERRTRSRLDAELRERGIDPTFIDKLNNQDAAGGFGTLIMSTPSLAGLEQMGIIDPESAGLIREGRLEGAAQSLARHAERNIDALRGAGIDPAVIQGIIGGQGAELAIVALGRFAADLPELEPLRNAGVFDEQASDAIRRGEWAAGFERVGTKGLEWSKRQTDAARSGVVDALTEQGLPRDLAEALSRADASAADRASAQWAKRRAKEVLIEAGLDPAMVDAQEAPQLGSFLADAAKNDPALQSLLEGTPPEILRRTIRDGDLGAFLAPGGALEIRNALTSMLAADGALPLVAPDTSSASIFDGRWIREQGFRASRVYGGAEAAAQAIIDKRWNDVRVIDLSDAVHSWGTSAGWEEVANITGSKAASLQGFAQKRPVDFAQLATLGKGPLRLPAASAEDPLLRIRDASRRLDVTRERIRDEAGLFVGTTR